MHSKPNLAKDLAEVNDAADAAVMRLLKQASEDEGANQDEPKSEPQKKAGPTSRPKSEERTPTRTPLPNNVTARYSCCQLERSFYPITPDSTRSF